MDLVTKRRSCLREAQVNVFPVIKLPSITDSSNIANIKDLDAIPHTEIRLSIDDDDDPIEESSTSYSKQDYILIEPTVDQYCILGMKTYHKWIHFEFISKFCELIQIYRI